MATDQEKLFAEIEYFLGSEQKKKAPLPKTRPSDVTFAMLELAQKNPNMGLDHAYYAARGKAEAALGFPIEILEVLA